MPQDGQVYCNNDTHCVVYNCYSPCHRSMYKIPLFNLYFCLNVKSSLQPLFASPITHTKKLLLIPHDIFFLGLGFRLSKVLHSNHLIFEKILFMFPIKTSNNFYLESQTFKTIMSL